MDYLLFTDDTAGAMRAAQRVGPAQVAIAKARVAVDDKAGNAKALLDAVPHDAHSDGALSLTAASSTCAAPTRSPRPRS